MTTKEADEARKQYEIGQALMKRMEREEGGEFNRSTTDPEFTVEELMKATGKSATQVRRLLRDAGLGFPALRHDGRQMRKTTIVRWSQIENMAKEFGW